MFSLRTAARRFASVGLAAGAAAAAAFMPAPALAQPGLERRSTVGSLAEIKRRLQVVEGSTAATHDQLRAFSTRLARVEHDLDLAAGGEPCTGGSADMSFGTLQRQDASTSTAIIDGFGDDADFAALAASEAESITTRDAEDDEKLAAGIALSVQRGVLAAHAEPPAYTEIDVLGKTPDQVAQLIIERSGVGAGRGGVVCVCGLSGTGKGTTVAKLHELLPGSVSWSNGNIFRCLTLLCSTWCEQNGVQFGADVVTPERVGEWVSMLEFGRWDGVWDTRVRGLGVDALVGQIKNTELKGPKVRGRIPTVAGLTQGEVVKFASAAVNQLAGGGVVVLLEGRSQTVDYIDTPHRFTLAMSDPLLIGRRRAAQRVGALALERLAAARAAAGEGAAELDAAAVAAALEAALAAIKAEGGSS
eukprot:g3166.t1